MFSVFALTPHPQISLSTTVIRVDTGNSTPGPGARGGGHTETHIPNIPYILKILATAGANYTLTRRARSYLLPPLGLQPRDRCARCVACRPFGWQRGELCSETRLRHVEAVARQAG